MDKNNKPTGVTVWKAVTHRTKENIWDYVHAHTFSHSTITTDAFRSYTGLNVRFHHVVNHSIGFKNDNGRTTNVAEGAHGVVKARLRSQCHKFGKDVRSVRLKVAYATMMYCRSSYGLRMQKILCVCRDFGDSEPVISPLSSEDEEDFLLHRNMVGNPAKGKLTQKGVPRKRRKRWTMKWRRRTSPAQDCCYAQSCPRTADHWRGCFRRH